VSERFYSWVMFLISSMYLARTIWECALGNYKWLWGLPLALPLMLLLPVHLLKPESINRAIEKFTCPVFDRWPFLFPLGLILSVAGLNYMLWKYFVFWFFLILVVLLDAAAGIMISVFVYVELKRKGWLE